jgi:hypothetical protein
MSGPAKKRETYGVTRSGYVFGIVSADDLLKEAGGPDEFTWSCGEKNCGAWIQGGRGALSEHRRVVHGIRPL